MDLNDLRYFALIVEHGGFTAAERATHLTKSKLSRRVALLEDRVDVAIRVRASGLEELGLVTRRVASGRMVLVASPAYLEGRGVVDDPSQIATLDTIAGQWDGVEQNWTLVSSDARTVRVSH